MPFSMVGKQSNKIIVTLQVRIGVCKITALISHGCGKRASPFVPFVRGKHSCALRASMTLEAALALSLFIFAAVSLILPMKIMTTQRRLQAGLEAVCEDFSRGAYLQDAMKKGGAELVPGADDFAKGFCKNLESAVAKEYAGAQTLKHADTSRLVRASMLRSSVMEDGETFDLILDYEIRMPCPVLGLSSIHGTVRSRRRAWIGRDGKDGSGAGDGGDEIVYVGRGSTRYHKSRSCHYLSNRLDQIPYDTVSEKRNESGGKYHACSVCGDRARAGDLVYIMPNGSSYHTDADCRAIIAYVRAVRLSEVEHLGACSYCGR